MEQLVEKEEKEEVEVVEGDSGGIGLLYVSERKLLMSIGHRSVLHFPQRTALHSLQTNPETKGLL